MHTSLPQTKLKCNYDTMSEWEKYLFTAESKVIFPTWIWDSALGHQLSQQDTEGPDVRFDGESAVQRCLWCSPLNGKLGS